MHKKPLITALSSPRTLAMTIFGLVCLFILFGILMVYNVSYVESSVQFADKYHFARGQIMWVGIALTACLVTYIVPTKFWVTIGPFTYILGLILLIVVLVPGIGVTVGGARRWLYFAGFTFQPSEAMKLGLILYLSTWLTKERRFISFALLVCLIFGLVMLQPDMGSGLILLSIAGGMYVVAGKPIKHLIWMAGFGVLGLSLLIAISPYRRERITTYLNPESDPLGKSYHIRQITLALGNGGMFGQGLGKSKQKYRYIPEATTDSIFAIIAEELGFFMCGIIIIGYITLFTQMSHWVKAVATSQVTYLLGAGIIAWLSSQVLVNLSSVVALIPLTGVPLPFISYGGSSMLMVLTGIGIFLGIGKHGYQTDTKKAKGRTKSL